uniref:Reverse transcriptase (RNA-dependent DNA polymerase) n=1 Tax=Candidatus Kentrum sp. SD TaxID=2126332 RepID=A0A451BN37_9GAMM|nr:MAG: Reverse transcriptase (RNA-dependent DNA polymerase) [Candidatus Kentron sp. SD]VFK42196.1 MAG: Reverse transcriptase (RNA-dependent DNA polymerase) [Candidatus Kentron sp. SD]VFK79715.1 MAG: Reverse transcriptase (RNA-dependent DNA polymerase) [Candidatus Kentron sp. SD]
MLANIALDSLDWLLDRQGLRFARYADNFVVMCRSHAKPEEALARVRSHLKNQLKLNPSPEKTRFASIEEDFEYLGFTLSSHSRTMREKSLENFKTKIRAKTCTITKRSHNPDDDLITQANRIVRGTANYLNLGKQKSRRTGTRTRVHPLRSRREALTYPATAASNNRSLFRKLDRWIRMRLFAFRSNENGQPIIAVSA